MKRLPAILALAAMLLLAGCSNKPQIGPLGGVHWHADFKVFVDGKPISFVKRELMVKAQYVHIENMDGDVIHVHASGVTIGEFFRTLGMQFDDECLEIGRNDYCSDEQKTLKFFVNGEPNELFGDYLISDQDQLLISYGPANEDVKEQLASITHKARAESGSGKEMDLH